MMTPSDLTADRIWENTLPLIRSERRRRGRIRLALRSGVICTVVAGWFLIRVKEDSAKIPRTVSQPTAPPPTLVVMRVGENGVTRLEEVSPSELGGVELAFGLTPMVSDELEEW